MPTQSVRIPTGDGELSAFLALPASSDTPRPGVIVLHEIFGLNDDIRRIARRFADNGYVALAPDMYSVGPRLRPLCVRRTMRTLADGEGRAFADIEATHAWLAARDEVDQSRMAVAGFCLGGGFALLHAARAEMGAVANFYGRVPRQAAELDGICPVYAGYGGRDRQYAAQPDRLRGHLDQLGVEHEVTVFPEAGHSFMNEQSGPVGSLMRYSRMSVGYHHESAETAWTKMLEFFERHLDGTNPSPSA